MNPVGRGIRNAFRNGVRTGAIVIILGLSIGLSLTMLVAQRAVENKIKSVKSSIGNTITISPAGFTPGSDANNALTSDDLAKVQKLAHVTSVAETLTDRLPTTGSSAPTFGKFGTGSDGGSSTSLTSPITLNAHGGGMGGERFFISGGEGGSLPADFSLPVSFIGTNHPANLTTDYSATIARGAQISGTADSNNALISSQMAVKNNLKVGDTFTAYSAALTVAGIFNTDNQAAQDTVIVSLAALQRLSAQGGVVTSAVATIDSLDNLGNATSAVKSTLGSNADVVSAQEEADNTVAPLNSVKTVSTFSLVGAVVAGAVIILLVMVMVVRERKKEIGVVKAIGGSNLRIMGEFMVESLTLAVLGAVVGLLIGVVGGQPVTKMLVDNSTSNTTTSTQFQRPGGRTFAANAEPNGGFGGRFDAGLRRNSAVEGLRNVKAQIGPGLLLDGFGAAVLIAILGSALSAGLIAKVRPSTVMRAE